MATGTPLTPRARHRRPANSARLVRGGLGLLLIAVAFLSCTDTAPTFGVVTDLTATTDDSDFVRLQWSAVPNAGLYYVFRSDGGENGEFAFLRTVAATTFYDVNIDPDTPYWYRVRPGDVFGRFEGEYSQTVQGRRPTATEDLAWSPTLAIGGERPVLAVDHFSETGAVYAATIAGTGGSSGTAAISVFRYVRRTDSWAQVGEAVGAVESADRSPFAIAVHNNRVFVAYADAALANRIAVQWLLVPAGSAANDSEALSELQWQTLPVADSMVAAADAPLVSATVLSDTAAAVHLLVTHRATTTDAGAVAQTAVKRPIGSSAAPPTDTATAWTTVPAAGAPTGSDTQVFWQVGELGNNAPATTVAAATVPTTAWAAAVKADGTVRLWRITTDGWAAGDSDFPALPAVRSRRGYVAVAGNESSAVVALWDSAAATAALRVFSWAASAGWSENSPYTLRPDPAAENAATVTAVTALATADSVAVATAPVGTTNAGRPIVAFVPAETSIGRVARYQPADGAAPWLDAVGDIANFTGRTPANLTMAVFNQLVVVAFDGGLVGTQARVYR